MVPFRAEAPKGQEEEPRVHRLHLQTDGGAQLSSGQGLG